MIRNNFIFGLALVLQSQLAMAIDLVCTNKIGFSVAFEVDEKQNSVMYLGNAAEDVHITKNEIIFSLNLDNNPYLYIINRTTGVLTIRDPNQNIFPPYTCEPAHPKF